jgi:hypothetical protein
MTRPPVGEAISAKRYIGVNRCLCCRFLDIGHDANDLAGDFDFYANAFGLGDIRHSFEIR